MGLNIPQLIVLNEIMYSRTFFGNGKTLKQTISDIKEYFYALKEQGKDMEWFFMSSEEIISFISITEKMIHDDPHFGNLTATQVKNMETKKFGTVVTYVNPDDYNESYVVFAGSGSAEWIDNCEGAFITATDYQLDALEYINSLPEKYGNNITVTGHSKGGNKAQYVTIMSDRVKECVSIDGQGFSDQFIEQYQHLIIQKKKHITSVSNAYDAVHAFLTPIAEKNIHVEPLGGPSVNIANMHKPNILLNTDGTLRREKKGTWVADQIHDNIGKVVEKIRKPAEAVIITKSLVNDIRSLATKKITDK